MFIRDYFLSNIMFHDSTRSHWNSQTSGKNEAEKKIQKFIKKIREGSDLVDKNDILHYEYDVKALTNYHPINFSHFKLTDRQKMPKSRFYLQNH